MIKIDQSSEQNILNMLVEHAVIDYNQVKKITEISKESGKTKLEIAIDLNFADEAKILKLLSTSMDQVLNVMYDNEKSNANHKLSISERLIMRFRLSS